MKIPKVFNRSWLTSVVSIFRGLLGGGVYRQACRRPRVGDCHCQRWEEVTIQQAKHERLTKRCLLGGKRPDNLHSTDRS